MIPDSELEVLRSFDGHGQTTLSVYLRVDTPQLRESARDRFVAEVQARLDECGDQPHCLEALQEDVEIVGLYLKTNGHRRHAGLAIFSCASALFWRAYPLSTPVPTKVVVGPKFDLGPLNGALGSA